MVSRVSLLYDDCGRIRGGYTFSPRRYIKSDDLNTKLNITSYHILKKTNYLISHN